MLPAGRMAVNATGFSEINSRTPARVSWSNKPFMLRPGTIIAIAVQPLAANAIKAVLNGGYPPVTSANPRPYGMPPYFSKLRDEEVAAVLTYVRASWGNGGAPVSTLDVERYR